MIRRKKKQMLFDLDTVDFSAIKKDSPTFIHDFNRAEAYLRESLKSKDFKKEAIKWIKKSDAKRAKALSVLVDWQFAIVGKLCYYLNRDADIIESGYTYIENKLAELDDLAADVNREKAKVAKQKSKVKHYTIQDYLSMKASAISGEYFESWVDEFIDDPKHFKSANYDPLTVMRTNELTQGHVRYIIAMYETNIAEIHAFLAGETAEYYTYTAKELKQLLALYENIIKAANMIISTSTAARKPRKTKAIDMSKQIARVNFLREHTELGLVSISPLKILGAKEVWVYNTKTRKIGKYTAFDSTGIDVKGTTLLNLSTDKCVQKTLRKPKEQLKNFKGGIRKCNSQFKALKTTEIPLKSRTNKDSIILVAFK